MTGHRTPGRGFFLWTGYFAAASRGVINMVKEDLSLSDMAETAD
jgi:hypothetical protein